MNIELVLPELRDFIENWQDLQLDPINIQQSMLAAQQDITNKNKQSYHGVMTKEYYIESFDRQDNIRLKVYQPKQESINKPVILYAHGGGFVMGYTEGRDQRLKYLCKTYNVVIVGVEYRLAPQYPFPIPQEDCYYALSWLHQNATLLGVDLNKIILWGNSAGGGLMASLALMVRDRQEFKIAYQFLLYPMLDDRTCIKPALVNTGKFFWREDHNQYAWQALLGEEPGSANISKYAAPARENDLTGLPPTFIAVGNLDLFLLENMQYAEKLMTAGVNTELHVYPGCFHAFDLVVNSKITKQFHKTFEQTLVRTIT